MNYNIEGSAVVTTSPTNMDHKIHVLLVEHDDEYHEWINNLLHKFSYRVTAVKLASTASSILSSENDQIDIMIANTNSPDGMDVFQLLREAVKMNVLVILMSNYDDAWTTMRALQEGAFLCIPKEAIMHIMEYPREHVVRERAYKRKQNKAIGEKDDIENMQTKSDDAKSRRNVNLGVLKHDNIIVKKKAWTRWTKDLHQKFIDAVIHLGEGRCFPKEILEHMNVPGLTRMQVASHLQICRNSTWIPSGDEKKSKQINAMKTLKNKAPRAKTLKLGAMPPLGTNCELPQGNQENHDINREELTIDPPRGTAMLDDGNHVNASLDEVFHPRFFHGQNDSNERDIIDNPFDFASLDSIIQDLYAFQSSALDQENHD